MIHGLLLFLHIVASIVLVISVLLQSSKGGGLSGTFGGAGISGGVFGGRGAAPFLVKATTVCAVLFMLTSISLNFVGSEPTPESVLERTMKKSVPIGSDPAVTNEMPISVDTDITEQGVAETEINTEGTPSEQTDNQD